MAGSKAAQIRGIIPSKQIQPPSQIAAISRAVLAQNWFKSDDLLDAKSIPNLIQILPRHKSWYLLFSPCLDSGLVGQVNGIRKKEALGELPSQGYYPGRGGWGAPVVDSVRLELAVVPSVENSGDY